MNEQFVKLKIINYSVYLYFTHCDRAINFKYLSFEPNVDAHFCFTPVSPMSGGLQLTPDIWPPDNWSPDI